MGRTATDNAVKTQLQIEAQVSTGGSGGAAGFGVGMVFNAESATDGQYRDQAKLGAEWTDATDATRNALVRLNTYPSGSAVGYSGFWSGTAIAAAAQTIILNAAGDVTKIITIQYAVNEITGAGTAGGVVVLTPTPTSWVLYNDGVDALTITCNANGSVTIARTAGADTFEATLWMVWR